MAPATQKVCSACGLDVSQKKRVKDPRTNFYYCHPCWEAQVQAAQHLATASPPQATFVEPLDDLSAAVAYSKPQPPSAPEERLSKGEHRIIFGGIVVGLLVLAGVVYFLFFRNLWEDQNRNNLLTLKQNAEVLAHAGRFAEAKAQYDQMFALLGNHHVAAADLHDSINSAHDDADHIAARISAQEQARQNDQRKEQEDAQQRDKAAVLKTQEAEAARQVAERQRQEGVRVAEQERVEEQRRLVAKQAAFDSQLTQVQNELQQGSVEDAYRHSKQAVQLQPKDERAIKLLVDASRQAISLCPLNPSRVIETGKKQVSQVAISPDGRVIVSTYIGDNSIDFWNADTGTIIRSSDAGALTIEITFSPDGRSLVSSHGLERFCVWDVATGNQVSRFSKKGASGGGLGNPIAVSASGSFFVSGGISASGRWEDEDHIIQDMQYPVDVYDLGTGRLAATLFGHTAPVECVAFSPDEKLIASGQGPSEFPRIKIWDKATGQPVMTIRGTREQPDAGHYYQVRSIAFTRDGRLLSTGDRTIRVWSVATGKCLLTTPEIGVFGLHLTLLPDGKRVAVVVLEKGNTSNRTVQIWDVDAGQYLQTLKDEAGGVNSIDICPKDSTLVLGADDGTIRLWRVTPDADWKKEAIAIVMLFNEKQKASLVELAKSDRIELAWAKNAMTGEAETAESQRVAEADAAEAARHAQVVAEEKQKRAEKERTGNTPQGAANRLCESLINNRQLISANFVEYEWKYGMKHAAELPSDNSIRLVNVVYDFTYTTQFGEQRTRRGYAVVEFHRNMASPNLTDGTWTPIKVNIDGRDLNPNGFTVSP